MRCAFHPEARLEYRNSAEFYAASRPGLGAEFTREVESVIEQICDSPDRWRLFEQDVRRCLTKRFPYAILYTIEESYILIVAVMHGSRKPDYWRHRIEQSN